MQPLDHQGTDRQKNAIHHEEDIKLLETLLKQAHQLRPMSSAEPGGTLEPILTSTEFEKLPENEYLHFSIKMRSILRKKVYISSCLWLKERAGWFTAITYSSLKSCST